ncbi:hypothetical protein Pelo_2235 [Pelomyxa schiedti]|nr:hypothetical protein Pelo_2235 [Pelomyxa schiedti]
MLCIRSFGSGSRRFWRKYSIRIGENIGSGEIGHIAENCIKSGPRSQGVIHFLMALAPSKNGAALVIYDAPQSTTRPDVLPPILVLPPPMSAITAGHICPPLGHDSAQPAVWGRTQFRQLWRRTTAAPFAAVTDDMTTNLY